jgi:hypothetical protein
VVSQTVKNYAMIQFEIRTLSGESETFDLDSASSIRDLQDAIHERLGVASEDQTLVLGRKPLTDVTTTLEDAGIKSGSCLTLLDKGGPRGPMEEYAKLMEETLQIMILEADTKDADVERRKDLNEFQMQKFSVVADKVFAHYFKDADNFDEAGLNDAQEKFFMDFAAKQVSIMVLATKMFMKKENKRDDSEVLKKAEEEAARQFEE